MPSSIKKSNALKEKLIWCRSYQVHVDKLDKMSKPGDIKKLA
jgi:hypothetical protein